MAEQPLIRLRDVGKVFANGTVAIEGLSLDIGAHEFLSLLGPSGCGKSTALKLIAGLGDATSGSIDWPDASTADHSADISFVFQEPTLMPWATVFKNVYLPLRLRGISKADATPKVREAIELVGLGGFEEVYPRELSGGMKMRVSIARALVTEPRVMLMDEPFAALDEITRFKLNDDLLRLWQTHKWTVIFVTHSVFESVFLSTRIAVMAARPGRLHEEMTVEAAYPRDEAFRTSTEYNDLCRRASATLHGAMGDTASALEAAQ